LGFRLVVRNGHHNEREVITAAGSVPVKVPRVNDKRTDETGQRRRFASAILPAWARKSPRVAEVLPLLYLHGLSSSDFGPALTQFLGTSHGLSPATITRLTEDWQDEAAAFNKRSLAETDHVYVWADGIHLKVRLEHDKVCLLVMIGVRADSTKGLVARDDGHRESTESWADLLRSCKRRGMRAPGPRGRRRRTGFLGRGPHRVPETREQRCWFHKIAKVLNVLPKSAQPGGRPRWPRSGTPKTRSTAKRLHGRSPPSTAPSGPRQPRRSPTTSTCCWRPTTTPPSTGSTCAPPTRSGCCTCEPGWGVASLARAGSGRP
jgi:putative transposase